VRAPSHARARSLSLCLRGAAAACCERGCRCGRRARRISPQYLPRRRVVGRPAWAAWPSLAVTSRVEGSACLLAARRIKCRLSITRKMDLDKGCDKVSSAAQLDGPRALGALCTACCMCTGIVHDRRGDLTLTSPFHRLVFVWPSCFIAFGWRAGSCCYVGPLCPRMCRLSRTSSQSPMCWSKG